MQKSFKKAIACLLAVLMVAFAMPFSAFAAVGDYEPDVQLQFSSFFDADESTDPTEKAASSTTCFESSGLAAFPIQYDAENGTLKATKEDINTYNTYWEADSVDADWELGEDDIFAVTIRFDNVDIAASGNVNIRYTDNLTPAGLCSYKSGKKTFYTFASEDNHPAGFQAELEGFRKPIKKFSASGLYEGMNDTLIGDLSCIQEDPAAVADDGWSDDMMTATLVCAGDHIDVSSIDASNGFFNIADGTYSETEGYTYPNQFIVATFVFQITGEGPIRFALQDPDGSLDPELNGASFFAKKGEGLAKENATTYAPNGTNPGSMKMTFMGENTNKSVTPPATTYTVTFLDKDGEQISSTSYEENAEVTIPDLPENTYDDDNHYTYAWNSEPSATATADATYQVVETSAAHSYGEGVEDPVATCTTTGTITYTCSCGKTYQTTSEVKAHSLGDWTVVEQAVAATCEAAGKTAVEKRFCANCSYYEQRGGATVEATGHNYKVTSIDWTTLNTETGKVIANYVCDNDNSHTTTGEVQTSSEVTQAATEEQVELTTFTYEEGTFKDSTTVQTGEKTTHVHNYTPSVTNPTCTAQGYTTYTCVCGDSYVGDYVNALGHNLGDWTVDTAEVPATCSSTGTTAVEKKECSRCDYSETRGGEEIPKLAHSLGDWTVDTAEVPATCKAAGTTAVEKRYCANCDYSETRGGDVIPALPHALGDWTVVTPGAAATCTTDGVTAVEKRTCANCDYSETRGGDKINATGHTEVTVDGVAPTCVSAGKTEGKYCSVCGAVTVAQSEIPATGVHTWNTVVNTKATIKKTGKKTLTCAVCGTTTTAKIAKNNVKVKGKTATVKLAKLKKKNQIVAQNKVIDLKNAKGKVTYTKTSGNKKIAINKTTGKVTVKKGLKKGTYKIKVKVKMAGDAEYKAETKTVTIKVKVK